MRKYDHRSIERKWQREWGKKKLYKTPDKINGKENFYLLTEFSYPSGNLHVGHWYAFSVPDILARALRMQGKNVLYPTGFDAFGLPAENAAIKNKLNPRVWTEKNMAYMEKQIKSMGTSFDWSRQVTTCDPAYYKWTQWQFLQFFKKGLAYQKETAVNWCPKDKTVLANEQVIDGRCERCESEVVQKQMLQWNMRITDYADRLIDDLEGLDWPEQIKESQRNWIGRSEGAEIDFPLVLEADKKKYTYVILHGYTGHPDAPRFLLWKAELEKQGHKVVIPTLPNPDMPSENEQVAVALAAAEYDEDTVLFGHSLGCVVAMKVVEKLKKPIARLVLAGGFVDRDFKDKRRPFDKNFTWKFDGAKIRKNAKTIQILHDPRDYAVSEEQLTRLESTLGVKATRLDSEEPHFTGEKELTVLRWLRPTITVFTTRADTLFGGTYLVLAPEHPWVTLALKHKTVLKNNDDVQRYVDQAAKKTELERQEEKEKTGVELKGVKAVNPATGKGIPVWVADFVIGTYGTGAVFADAHDERDWDFAKKYNIPLKETLEPLAVITSGVDAVRDEPLIKRRAISAIIKHPTEEKYLGVTYKPTNVRGFVSGGIEEGEDPIEAALREIREETGYTKAKLIRSLGSALHGQFYSIKYKRNSHSQYTPFLFQLEDLTREEISPKEKAEHDMEWMTPSEIDAFINRGDLRAAWDRLNGRPYTGKGILYDSGEFNGLTSDEAIPKVGATFGRLVKQYHLRDWIVSRQRYWGVPIPIIHCPKCGPQAVSDKELPVKLPEVKDYLPDGRGKSPLAKAKKWVTVKCPKCKGKAERETDTLDTFVDSSWYFLRYADPKNSRKFADAKKMGNWMPVNLYSGGAEHTTMHVLYSRFWHKALFDLGLVVDKEPYTRRMNRSLILGPDGQKMSKSRGNVVDPDKVVERLGADTVRMYLAFIGPYNEVSSYPWNPDGVVGIRRFLERVWRVGQRPADIMDVGHPYIESLENTLHKTIKKVGEDIAALKFNTAISALMIFLNAVEKEALRQAQGKAIGKDQWSIFLRLLAPFAPHISEELWEIAGNKKSVHVSKWPEYDASKLRDETVSIAIQINGKTRGEVSVAADADKVTVEKAAREAIASRLEGKRITRTIVVPNRLVNFVVAE
ncbi:class I tRNA ligase family protein [Candidatus Kaiserbacteria bacterium]|nr:class I tRNA ligase family protein [Candidatus Kaiserbacteria bacterium]